VHLLSQLKDLFLNILAAAAARFYLRKAELGGKRIRLWGKPALQISGRLFVGDRVRLVSTITALEIAVGAKALLEIGENTFINYGTSIAAQEMVKIGRNCLIGTYVNITDNNFHHLEPDRRLEIPPSAPVVVGDNVWLGTRAIVLPGVTIGDDSVIGAGSVVTRSIPSGVVAAGAPARVIRKL
jgi:acetyltransferase-like isoleucine patch superfamily enzyme